MRSFARLGTLSLLVLGCTEHIELSSGMDASFEDVPEHCHVLAQQCSSGEECCSGLCESGLCGGCAVAGAACASPSDCCSFLCEGGFCAASPSCAVAGESCDDSADCCSRACATEASGAVVCHALGGCRPAGELCRGDADCCDAAAGPGACEIFDASAGVGRCRPPVGCAQPGELCDPSAATCCPGGAIGEQRCQPAEVANVDRCVSEQALVACLPAGAVCAGPAECCDDRCAPSVAGILSCQADCSPEGSPCSRSADCCAGVCERSVCRPTIGVCAPIGAACTSDAACCSAVCSPETGTCSAFI